MEFGSDLQNQALEQAQRLWDIALGWLVSPAAWSQFALLVVAYLLALVVAGKLRGPLTRLLSPPEDLDSPLARFRIGQSHALQQHSAG